MIDFTKFKSIVSLTSYFNTNEKCIQAIVETRWPNRNVICPYCGMHSCSSRKDGRYRCHSCGNNFSALVGTIFENTKLPMIKWFIALFLNSSHKKGVSSVQLSKDIDVTQKTAWFMLLKIRTLYKPTNIKLQGEIEVDEAYIGGKEKWKHYSKKSETAIGRSTKTKTPIFGLMERNGRMIAKVVKNTTKDILLPIIEENVIKGSVIYSDEYSIYKGLLDLGFSHNEVFHKQKKFVVGESHTNSIEGFWGHLKRMIYGTYHSVSPTWLQMYVNEQIFRWNTRNISDEARIKIIFKHIFERVKAQKKVLEDNF